MNVRAHAALTLAPVIRGEESLQHSFDAAVMQVEERDRGLFHELVYGVLRHYEWLDARFRVLVSKKLKNKDTDIAMLVLLGIYQLEYMRVPDHAALSETVNAVKVLKKHWAKGLINATLRNFGRKRDELERDLETTLEAKHCLPWWLLSQLKQDWPDTPAWQDIADAIKHKPPVTLRNNALRQSRDELVAVLRSNDIESRACAWSPQGITLESNSDINRVEGLRTGLVSVQDEAAQLAAPLLELSDGMKVLDACAAPGGKTCHILESANNLNVSAVEFDPERAKQIEANLERQNLNADIHVGDATNLSAWWDGQPFDRILLDAPCSAAGVIRRHPDIKRLRRESDLAKLARTQAELLRALWSTLAPGGILVYATCSILKCENEIVVGEFLAEHSDAEHIDLDVSWGHARPYGRQLMPQINGHDGFYYAKLKKR